jgi:DNA-binding FrmR family transcriptional regulator
MTNDGWSEHKREVLYRLRKMEEQLTSIDRKMDDVCLSVAVLKAKAAFIGGVAGVIASALVSIAVRFI